MNILKENYLTMQFSAEGEFGNEVKLIKSIFKKVDTIASKPGFKRDFDPMEIDLIRSLHMTVNSPEFDKDKP